MMRNSAKALLGGGGDGGGFRNRALAKLRPGGGFRFSAWDLEFRLCRNFGRA